MRVTGNNGVEGQPLFPSYKSPSPTYYSSLSPTRGEASGPPSSYNNGDGHTRSYKNRCETYPLPSLLNYPSPSLSNYATSSLSNYPTPSLSSYSNSSPDRPTRSFSPSKFESLPVSGSSSCTSPRMASKFPRYFSSAGRTDLVPSSSPLSHHSPVTAESPTRDYGYGSGGLPPSSFLDQSPPYSCGDSGSRGGLSSGRFNSLPPLAKLDSAEERRSSSPPLFSSNTYGGPSSLTSSRLENGLSLSSPYRSGSPKFGSASSTSGYESPNASSFLKLARLNLTPVKFRAKKLTALG